MTFQNNQENPINGESKIRYIFSAEFLLKKHLIGLITCNNHLDDIDGLAELSCNSNDDDVCNLFNIDKDQDNDVNIENSAISNSTESAAAVNLNGLCSIIEYMY